MASLRVLAFDHESRPVQFDTWLDDLQLYLLSDSKDSVLLFDLASGAASDPPATADTQALYDAVVARNSSPATAALGRLLLPYMFPEMSAFTTVEDLVSHLRASDGRYRAAIHAEDHFLSLDPTSLTVDLLEQHLLVAKTSAVAVGAARGTLRPPFFEGCSPSPLAPSYAFAAAADVSNAEDIGAASASAKRCSSKGKGGRGGGGGSGGGGGGSGGGGGGSGSSGGGSSGGGGGGGTVGGSGGSGGGGGGSGGSGGSGGGGTGGGGTGGGGTGAWRVGSGGGQRQQQQRRSETPSPQQLREWFLRGASGGSCPYVIRTGDGAGQTCGRLHTQHRRFSRLDDAWRAEFGDDVELPPCADLLGAEGDCYRCVLPDPGIAAAALGASESGTLLGTAPVEALHTFTLDSDASRYFFRDSTTLTPLPARVPVRLADPSGGPDVARSSTVLLCLAFPSGSLLGLHLPLFSMNLVSTAALQNAMVTTTTPRGQRVSICTCARTERHLATFTRRPGSSLYTLATEPSHVAASAQVSASGQVAASSSCRLLSHQTLLWHHRMGHPSLPRLCGMQSRHLVSGSQGLCLSFRPRLPRPASLASRGGSTPLLTTPRFPRRLLPCRLSTWTFRLQLRECFGTDLPVLRLHSDRGDSPQQKGIAERRISLVIEVARTSMIHAAAPHFLWPFAVRYAAHQLNLWPCVSLPETSPTLRWTGKVGDASVFRVWGSPAFVRDTSADKLSPHAIPCVFLGFVPVAPGRTFDEWVPFYRLFPYRSAPPSPPLLFLAPGPPTVAVDSGASRGAASGGAELEGAEFEGVETRGAAPGGVARGSGVPGGAEPEGVERGGAASEGAESGGTEPQGAASSGGSAGASPRLSPQQLREWFVRRLRLRSVASGAGGAGGAGAGGTGVAAGAGVTGGTATTGLGGARTRGTGAARTGGVAGAGAGDLTEFGTTGVGGAGAGGAGVGGPGAGGAGEGGPGVGGAGAGGAGAIDPGGTVRPRPYFIPLLQHVLGTPPSAALTPPLLCPPPDQSQPPLQPASPLPAPSPYTKQSGGLTERRGPASRPVSPVCTARRVPRSRSPPVPGMHAITLRPSSVPLRVSLPAPPESSLPEVPDPESDRVRAASPTVSRLLATAITDPSFESAAASALVAELLDFAAACRLDYATALVAVLRRPVLRSSGWHDTLAALGFALATADPSLFLRTDTSLPPFYVLVYVDDLVFATADTEALTLVKSELQKRHTCIDLGELRSNLGLQITRDRARRTITLTQSHIVHQVLQLFGFQFSSPQPTPLSTCHSLSAPPSDESVEPSGPYPELVGCLVYLMTCTRPDPAYPLSLLARCVALGRHRKYVGHGAHAWRTGPVVLTGHADASWVDDSATQRSSQGYTFSLGSGSVSWRSTRSSLVLSSSCETEIYAGAMAAQELRWLTYLLTDLGEQPRSPRVLYVDNKAMIALCQ
ncbi:unnamed protein product [Closterium sp. NIES-54]